MTDPSRPDQPEQSSSSNGPDTPLDADSSSLDRTQLLAIVKALAAERRTEATRRESDSGSGAAASSVDGLPAASQPKISSQLVSMSRDLFVNAVPAILAVAAGLFFLPSAFERERALARPILSLEYVFMMRDSYALSEPVRDLLKATASSPIYHEFFSKTMLSGKRFNLFDLRIAAELSAAQFSRSVAATATDTVTAFLEFLAEATIRNSALAQDVEKMSPDEIRQWAFLNLEGVPSGDTAGLRQRIAASAADRAKAIVAVQSKASALYEALSTQTGGVRMRVTILNKGATDGLIRPHGEVVYQGQPYEIRRTSVPSADMGLAVPVFQTNQPDEGLELQSVGKIGSDSMAEVWFEFRPDKTQAAKAQRLCVPGEKVKITLFDHEREPITGFLECDEEGE